jgi:hypothetical protein
MATGRQCGITRRGSIASVLMRIHGRLAEIYRQCMVNFLHLCYMTSLAAVVVERCERGCWQLVGTVAARGGV